METIGMKRKYPKAFIYQEFQALERFFEKQLMLELGTLSWLRFFSSSTDRLHVNVRQNMIRWLRAHIWCNTVNWVDVGRMTKEELNTLIGQGYVPISTHMMGALLRMQGTGIAKYIRQARRNKTWSEAWLTVRESLPHE